MARTLSIGMTGEDVSALQRLLNYHLTLPRYAPLTVDRDFGPATQERVKEFQRLNQNYLVLMPIDESSGIKKKPLVIDGVAGPNTGYVLLDIRTVTLHPSTQFAPAGDNSDTAQNRAEFQVTQTAAGDPPQPNNSQPSPPQLQLPTQAQFITLQAGIQGSLNPWAISPFVLTGQFTYLARNEGKPDLLLTFGGQFSQNLGTVNGSWTGQVFGQMGLGNIGLTLGPVDFFNPFVQIMLQKNQGQQAQAGLAIGNQITWSLIDTTFNGISQPRLSVFLNLQGVVDVGLNDGFCSAPSAQGLLGLGWAFDPKFFRF